MKECHQALHSNDQKGVGNRDFVAVKSICTGEYLTDGALVSSGVVDFVVAHSLRPVHGLVEHVELHGLLLHQLLLVARVHTVVLPLVLRVVVVTRKAQLVVLGLDHVSARSILEVALLLVCLNGDVSVHTVVVFFLLCEHITFSSL